ncbi:MAG: EAL domain-containing protein [Chloroflexi bacterium]|nr:MAG: EAL domain-containing protein [Chloroflexota bacterium]
MVRNGTANGTAARSQAAEIDRLKRRLDRERLARREAEAIAERTTRGLYDEVAARTRELECIVDMGRELAQSLDDRGFADLIASHIARAVGFDECGIFAWDKIQDTVVTAGYHPAARRSALIDVYPLDDYPETRRVLMSGQRSITDPADPTADSSEVSFLLGMGGKLMIQLPMNVGGRTIGTVELISLSGQMLSDRQIDLAQSMASEAGVMLENARLYAEVRHQAFHDHLTGLPNRALLGDRMEHALARGRAPKLPLVGLVFVDVDDFKVINDSHGHEVGDRALIAISQRLQQLVRSGDTVARFSGDEFAILIEDLESPEDAHLAARRVVRAFQKPLTVAGREITMSVSVGVDVGNALSTTPEDLVRNADFAMYIAKASGKSQHEVYQASARAAADDGAKMRSDLRGAVRRGELRLHYQPIIELRSGRIRSFEALIRWQHPERGLLSPAAFIPTAEATGAIIGIGDWVLETACKQLRAWQELEPELAVSVNLSGSQLHDGHVIEHVASILDRTGLDPRTLILEMTETILVADPGAERVLRELQNLGVRLAIDDFGTGYASISYLRRFAVDILKIDREFTDAVDTAEGTALLGGITQLGRSLGLELVAEGIERPRQAELVRNAGCDLGQGFLFARPAPPEDAAALLRPGGLPIQASSITS